MNVVRSVTVLCALIGLAACSTGSPMPMQVVLCNAWADEVNAAPAGSFDFTVSVDGVNTSVGLGIGACADLGPYTAGTEVTITESVPDGLIVVAIERVARGSGAEQVVAQPSTPATTFRVEAYEEIVFLNAVRVHSTVAITSVASTATELPVDPTAVAGSIDVTVTVSPGNDGLRRLEAFVGDHKVHERVFEPAAAAEASGGVPFDVAFTVATNAYTAEGGVATVAFPNGAYTLAARLETVAGGATGAVQDQTDLTFENADVVDVHVEAGAEAEDVGGLLWWGQGLTATFAHVAYSGAAASEFNSRFAGIPRTTNPAVWTAANVSGFNSTAAGSNLTVDAITAGTPGPSAIVSVRYDGVAPRVGSAAGLANDFTLTEQLADGEERCCSNNWLHSGYAFDQREPTASDVVGGIVGVGGVTITYHAGPAILTDLELAALAAVATPAAAGLAPSAVNTTYSVVARVADALDNVTLLRLVGSGVNPSRTFGLAAVAPSGQAILAGSVEDRTIYNANLPGFGPFASGTIGLTAVDDAAGFGLAAVATSFRYNNAADGITCLVGATAACTPTQQPLSFATDNTDSYPGAGAVTQGYYQYRGEVHDQAGLGSGTTSVVTYLFDQTRPNVNNIAGMAGSFQPGQPYAFSANATDNVDLKQAHFALVFAGLTGTNLDAVPMAARQSLGTPWAFENPTTSAPVSATVPFVTGMETTAAGAPSGVLFPVTGARFVVSDVAENQSTQQNAFAPGSFPLPVSFAAGVTPLFPAGATFQQATASVNVCFNANQACTAPAVRTVTLTATATGAAGTFANPFAFVLFAYVDNIDVGGGEFTYRFIGSDGTATMQDVGATRTWTWSVTLSGADLVLVTAGLPYVLPVQAIGVNTGTGTGLLAATGTAITVIGN